MGNVDFDDEVDLYDDEKYLNSRRDSKSSKQKNHNHQRLDRRNSTGNITGKMDTLGQQPAVEKTQEFHVKEVKPKLDRNRSSSSSEADIDEELANLVKDMAIKPIADLEIPKNVYYYGWFFGQTASDSLKKLVDAYFKECFELQQFQRWIDVIGGVREKGARDVASFYAAAQKALLHITAKFCGSTECVPYSEQAQLHVGSEFNLAIVGVFFTEKTCGLRVKLTEEQGKLFEKERGRLISRRNSSFTIAAETEAPPQETKTQVNRKKSKLAETAEKKRPSKYPGLTFVTQRENFQPTDTRAHVTIGCGFKIKAKQTGEDLLDIIDMELRSSTSFHDYNIPSGTLRQFGRHGDYVFVLYPKNRVFVKGVFMPVF